MHIHGFYFSFSLSRSLLQSLNPQTFPMHVNNYLKLLKWLISPRDHRLIFESKLFFGYCLNGVYTQLFITVKIYLNNIYIYLYLLIWRRVYCILITTKNTTKQFNHACYSILRVLRITFCIIFCTHIVD
jgi:hypothetical protein